MKKIFLAGIMILVIAPAFAQEKYTFGMHISPSYAWLRPNVLNVTNHKAKMGFSYGLFLDNNFSDNYAFATGFTVSHNGGTLIYNDTVTTFKADALQHKDTSSGLLVPDVFPGGTRVRYSLQHIEIPVTLKLTMNEIGYITPFVQLGFSTRFNIKARANIREVSNTLIEEKIDIRRDVTIFGFAMYVGAGIEYALGGNTALIAAIYFSNGFTDVTNDKVEDDKTAAYKVVANYMSLRMGIIF